MRYTGLHDEISGGRANSGVASRREAGFDNAGRQSGRGFAGQRAGARADFGRYGQRADFVLRRGYSDVPAAFARLGPRE